jgi:isopentenyldiphosphate isomerase
MFAQGAAMTADPGYEFVDLLDEAGRVIGTVARRDLRGRRIPHRCAYLLVFNKRGDLFIHQRTATKDTHPLYWDVCVGGLPAAGESFDAAVRREAEEEIGVAVEPELMFSFRYADASSIVFGTAYRAVHDGPFRFQREEVLRGEFVTPPEAAARIESEAFCPDGAAVFAEYRKRIGKTMHKPQGYCWSADWSGGAL